MSDLNRKVLVFLHRYAPGYLAGGPIPSVANMAKLMADEFEFAIVAGNTDLGSDTPYTSVPSDEWTQWDGTAVIYLSQSNQTPRRIMELLQSSDARIVYLNSLWSVRYAVLPLLLIKFRRLRIQVVVAPRGGLGAGALRLKRLKKKCFLLLTRLTCFFKDVVWHASTALEEEEIRLHYGENCCVVAARDIAMQTVDTTVQLPKKHPGEARFFFISRVSRHKNLLGAIRAMQRVATDRKVTYDIYGPIEDPGYWKECETLIAQRPDARIRYHGPVSPPELSRVIRRHHFFFMPTFGENYGHVIVEALVNGCPVIISDQTPWLGLQDKQVGWDVSIDDEARLVEVLKQCIDMGQARFDCMSEAAAEYGAESMCTPAVLENNRQLFRVALARKELRGCKRT